MTSGRFLIEESMLIKSAFRFSGAVRADKDGCFGPPSVKAINWGYGHNVGPTIRAGLPSSIQLVEKGFGHCGCLTNTI